MSPFSLGLAKIADRFQLLALIVLGFFMILLCNTDHLAVVVIFCKTLIVLQSAFCFASFRYLER
jgi:hypothetical protein